MSRHARIQGILEEFKRKVAVLPKGILMETNFQTEIGVAKVQLLGVIAEILVELDPRPYRRKIEVDPQSRRVFSLSSGRKQMTDEDVPVPRTTPPRMIFCNTCLYGIISEDSKFCPRCGVKLSPAFRMLICTKGCPVKYEVSGPKICFCTECGSQLSEEPPKAEGE